MKRKQKQPYIPFYVGDYLTDTRILPLNVRGAWVDLILYMWNHEPKGEITGTYEDFARLIGCSVEEMKFCIDLLNQKKICDHVLLPDKHMKIISRKIKDIVDISEKRKNAGKMGGNPNLINQNLLFALEPALSKDNQKPEYEYEYKDESNNTSLNTEGGLGETKLKYENFKKGVLANQWWCEEVCMKTRSKLEDIPAMIDNFISHCIMGGETHLTEKEFKTHFRNVCLRNIEIVKPKIDIVSQNGTVSLEERAENFRKQVLLYSNLYDKQTLEGFFTHWTQRDGQKNLLKFEMEQVFDLPNKIHSWKQNGKQFKNGHSKPTKENVAGSTRNFPFGAGQNT